MAGRYDAELSVALSALELAVKLCESLRGDGEFLAEIKADSSPVTLADLGSQAVICRALAMAYPNDAVLAEEDAANVATWRVGALASRLRQLVPDATISRVLEWLARGAGAPAERFWTLDPVDGTKGYMRGGQYAIAIALIEEGQVVLGALACPRLPLDPARAEAGTGVLAAAIRGEGATIGALGDGPREALRVPERSAGLATLTQSFESSHCDHARQEAVALNAGLSVGSLRMDSQAKYAAVARGEAGLYLRLPAPGGADYRELIWDHAAGSLIVTEAGGVVTDAGGRPLGFGKGRELEAAGGIVASSSSGLHTRVLEELGASATS